MSIGSIVIAVFFAWILFGQDMVAHLRAAYNRRLAHRERMAALEIEKARALAARPPTPTPSPPTRNDVPQELIDAWHEVNELTHE